MKDLEGNKILASILVAGLILMVAGKITDILYHPELSPETRGYQIEIAEQSGDTNTASQKEEAPIDINALLASANIEAGQKLFKKCASCHSIEPNGPHKIGPNIWNIVNQPIATRDFPYSDALKSIGKTWTPTELAAFLRKPKEYAKGTKMSFIGLKKPQDQANMIAYLKANGN